jgi:hypothetical protein
MHLGNERASLTHPDYASLVDPLFSCARKRVKKNLFRNIAKFNHAITTKNYPLLQSNRNEIR